MTKDPMTAAEQGLIENAADLMNGAPEEMSHLDDLDRAVMKARKDGVLPEGTWSAWTSFREALKAADREWNPDTYAEHDEREEAEAKAEERRQNADYRRASGV